MAKKRIAIIACKNIKGVSCVGGCLKCFKGISEKTGEYEHWKDYDIEVIGMDDCGGLRKLFHTDCERPPTLNLHRRTRLRN